MAWRSHRIVANMLENTRREFGGVGWPGCGMVDRPSTGRSAAALRKSNPRHRQESVKVVFLAGPVRIGDSQCSTTNDIFAFTPCCSLDC